MAQAATAFGVFVGILSVYNTFKDPATPPGGPAHQNSFVVSMEAGQDHGVELIGAAGMRPTVELWDLNGDPIGVNSESEMIDTARNIKFFVDPVSKEKQGVDPVYLTLRARGRDPVCLTELTVSNPLSGRQYAFAAAMAKGCGSPWANSGMGQGRMENVTDVPCMWFGEKTSVQWLQVNLRASTTPEAGGDPIDWVELNKSATAVHDWFCNTPSRLHTLDHAPDNSADALITDDTIRGDRAEPYSEEEVKKNHQPAAGVHRLLSWVA